MKFTNYLSVFTLFCALAACSHRSVTTEDPMATGQVDTTSSKILYWLTNADQSSLLDRQPAIAYAASANTNPTITIDTTETFQTMDGFGYTLTSGSAKLINKMSDAAKAKLLNELFADDENSIHISYVRISIGASDLSDSVYTYDDMPAGQTDVNLDHFSLQPDKNDLVPLLKQVVAINPDINIIATPWTAPLWMKDNEKSTGGSLKPEYHGAYADYFVKYIQAMKREGINISAITPQNEPLNDGNNPSLKMEAAQQADFIKSNLGPAFRSASIATRIIVYDHNCDRPDYPLAILSDAAAKDFVDGSAFHLYAGDIAAMSQVHGAHPDKNVYFTEQYTASTGQFSGDLRWHIRNLVIGAPRNWSRTVFEWNLANDVNYGPHTPGGCTTCKGALTIDGDGVKKNVAYYIIAHISKFVPPGSVRVGSNTSGSLQNVAFKTPSGKTILIVLNDSQTEAKFNISIHGKVAPAGLAGGAVATFVVE